MRPKHKTEVLKFGTPSQPFHLVITREDGQHYYYANSNNAADLMGLLDVAVQEAKEATEQDGIMRTVSIEQVILQKNVVTGALVSK